MSDLSPRQEAIFHRVVDKYIESAQPVGSRSISELYHELYQESYSPATVRQEMGRLEDRGYLMHPHTSAGRVPTDQGYRYYVNRSVLGTSSQDSDLADVESSSVVMNSEDRDQLNEELCESLSSQVDQIAIMVSPVQFRRSASSRLKLYLRGSSRMLNKPEFQNLSRVKPLFETLEEKRQLLDWLVETMSEEKERSVRISIGNENERPEFSECTLIRSSFFVDGKKTGVIAVMGPKRLPYKKVIPMVSMMARRMNYFMQD